MFGINPKTLRPLDAEVPAEIMATYECAKQLNGAVRSSLPFAMSRVSKVSSDKLVETLKEALTQLDMEEDNLAWAEACSNWIDSSDFNKLATTPLKEQAMVFKRLAQTIPPRPLFSFQRVYIELKEVFFKLIRMLVDTFGVADFFEVADNRMHAQGRGWRIMFLMQIFDMLSRVLKLVFFDNRAPDEQKSLVENKINLMAGLFLGFNIVLSIVNRFFSPRPWYIPGAVNWTQMIRRSQFPASDLRQEICARIYQKMRMQTGGSVHTMLVGPTGVGKTQAARTFAKGVHDGRYPELAGKTVFYINCADIVNSSEVFRGGSRGVARIAEAIGNYRDDIILVFDEVHLICQQREGVSLAEEFKTQLDPSGQFKHVIGITTEEEYRRDVAKDGAFARRFGQPIDVELMEMSDTLTLLNQQAVNQGLFLEEGVLEAIVEKSSGLRMYDLYDKLKAHVPPENEEFSQDALFKLAEEMGGKAKEGAVGILGQGLGKMGVELERNVLESIVNATCYPVQPAASLQLFSTCVTHLSTREVSKDEEAMIEAEQKIAQLRTQVLANGPLGADALKSVGEKIAPLEAKLRKMEKSVKSEKRDYARLQTMRDRMAPMKNKMMELAVKADTLSAQELAHFALLKDGLLPMLEGRIKNLSERLGSQVVLTKELVGELAKDYVELAGEEF